MFKKNDLYSIIFLYGRKWRGSNANEKDIYKY